MQKMSLEDWKSSSYLSGGSAAYVGRIVRKFSEGSSIRQQ